MSSLTRRARCARRPNSGRRRGFRVRGKSLRVSPSGKRGPSLVATWVKRLARGRNHLSTHLHSIGGNENSNGAIYSPLRRSKTYYAASGKTCSWLVAAASRRGGSAAGSRRFERTWRVSVGSL